MTRDRVSYDANWNGRRVHRRRHRRLGPGRQGPRRPGRGAGRGRGRRRPTRCCSWSTRPSASPTPTRPSSRSCAGPASRWCWRPTRSTTRGPRPRPRRCGPSASASRTRSPRCTAAAAATCSTPCSPRCPRRRRRPFDDEGGPRRVALVGQPNVGKSSLLNQLAGADRVVVDSVAGTTVDPVDELIELGGRDLAVRRHRRHPPAGQGGQRHRVLRVAAHPVGARPGRGGRGAGRRERAALRAGHCGSSRWSSRPAGRW